MVSWWRSGWDEAEKRSWKCTSCLLLPYKIHLKLKGVRGQCSSRVNTWREIYRDGDRGRAVKEKVFMPWNSTFACSNRFRVNVALGLTWAFSFTYGFFFSFWTLCQPCVGVSRLLSPNLLDSEPATMLEGCRDDILNQLNAIVSVNF